jgi:deazaflavin-dependent oxidoreductase (nitroreductase family)
MGNYTLTRSWYGRIAVKIASSRVGGWYFTRISHHFDRFLLKVTRGRVHSVPGAPVLSLTTIGAKSGLPRTTPLVYVQIGNQIGLVASNGGNSQHPSWYYNLRAHPEAHLLFRGQERDSVAHEAQDEEREKWWREAVAVYPGYAVYQSRTTRHIPVMVLTPKH